MKPSRERPTEVSLTRVVVVWTATALALAAGAPSSVAAASTTDPVHPASVAQRSPHLLLAQNEAGGSAAWDAAGGTAALPDAAGSAAAGAKHDAGAAAGSSGTATAASKSSSPPRSRPVAAEPRSCGPQCRVFATRATFTGELGGVEGGDRKCVEAARAAGLGGRWSAWLSCAHCAPGGKGIDAGSRLHDAEYRLVGGGLVAPSLDSMIGCRSQCLRSPIDRDEFGAPIAANERLRVWTGTFGSGIGRGRPNCRDWSTGEIGEDGEVGELTRISEDWTSRSALTSCGEESRLYCFEQ